MTDRRGRRQAQEPIGAGPRGCCHEACGWGRELTGRGGFGSCVAEPCARPSGSRCLGRLCKVRPLLTQLDHWGSTVIEAAENGGPGSGRPRAGLTARGVAHGDTRLLPASVGAHSCFPLAAGARPAPAQLGWRGCGHTVSASSRADLQGAQESASPLRTSERGEGGYGDGCFPRAMCLLVTAQGPELSPSLRRASLAGHGRGQLLTAWGHAVQGTPRPSFLLALLLGCAVPQGRESGTVCCKASVLTSPRLSVPSGLEGALRQHRPRGEPGTQSVVGGNLLARGRATETPVILAL